MEQPQAPVVAAAQPTGPQGPQGNLPAPDPAILSPIVLEHMDELEQMRNMLDGKLGDAYDRVLTAGMKMMYSADNSQMMQEIIMDESIPIANKLGEGIANLLVMMDNQANGSIPKDTLIPAGVALMFEAADYMFECGFDVSEKDLADSMETLVYGVFQGYQIPPEKVDEVIDDIGKKMGFEEGDADKVMNKVESAQEKGVVREPIPGSTEEDAAFEQGFNEQRGV